MQVSGKFRDKVYVTRNGKTYLRKYTRPPEPNSPEQLAHQEKIRQLGKSWSELPDSTKQAYNLRAEQSPKPITGYGLYWKEHLKKP